MNRWLHPETTFRSRLRAGAAGLCARKRLLVGVATGLVLVATVCALVAWIWGSPRVLPDPEGLDREQVVRAMASPAFAAQSPELRRRYADRARELAQQSEGRGFGNVELSDEERQQLRDNMRATFMEAERERIEAYFALPEGPERVAYLDRMIDEFAERAARRDAERTDRAPEGRPDGPPEGRSSGDRDPNRAGRSRADRMRERLESTPPEERAMFAEFMKDLRERMEARGIQLRGPGAGRGPRPG